MEITKEEFMLAIVFAVGGFIASMKETIMFLNGLNPLQGLLVYYVILYGCLLVLSHFGLVIWKFKIDDPREAFGLLLITFAFFILVNWESCYVNTVTNGNCLGVSPAFFGSEDGATYYFWTSIANFDTELARYFTYVITPFTLVIFGAALLEQKPEFQGDYA